MQRTNMTKESVRAAPQNFFILVFGAWFLLLIFCLIFCCYFLRLKQQEQYRRRGYKKDPSALPASLFR
ncbi:hypothetical protein GDO81_004194 [Engystomops pustulosus]|uniref:Uncharacterized protein n=1 Tax=Engystomops pustulosus TaxID=76066 RepID=A0AAV6ZYC8_ENGPU|nr:hypothetical protein GDO81_004194 [Engystomops pustulosus]